MTTSVFKLNAREDATFEQHAGQIVETWRVKGPTNPFAVLAARDGSTGLMLPKFGDRHAQHPAAVCTNIDPSYVPESVYSWDVSVTFKIAGLVSPGSSGREEDDRGRPQIDRIIQPLEIYRVETPASKYQFPGGIDTPTQGQAGDIGGVGVDSAGEPIDLPYIYHVLTWTWEVKGGVNERIIFNLMRRRNQRAFRGYPGGSLLFRGAKTSPIGRKFTQVSMEFVADELFHLRQRIVKGVDGLPKLVKKPTPTDDNAVTDIVNWWQPFPEVGDFFQLGIPAP